MTRLEEQIEGFEADVEALAGEGRRAGGGAPPHRQEELEALIARHRQHIVRLEQVLRLMENDQVCTRGPLLGGGVALLFAPASVSDTPGRSCV